MKLLLAVAALLAVCVESATAQAPGIDAIDSSKPSSNIIILDRGRDVEKDLGVSDDVARNLAILRGEYQAAIQKEYQDAGLNPLQVPKMTAEQRNTFFEIGQRVNGEYVAKAAALLSPEQITRLRQIELQLALSARGLGALLHREVALDLKLTGNQRQAMNLLSSEYRQASSGGGLSREQTSKLRAEYLDKAIELLTGEQREILSELKGRDYLGRR